MAISNMPGKQLLCCIIWQRNVSVLVGIVYNYLVFKLAPVAERSEVPAHGAVSV